MSITTARRWIQGGYRAPTDRRLLAALARVIVENPADARVAVRLLEAARVTGRGDWLRRFTAAAVRRLPTSAMLFLRAEIAYDEHGYSAGIELARRAHAAGPPQAEVDISYAAALAGTGNPLQAFEVLSPWTREPRNWAALAEPSLRRLAAIVAAAAPDTLGELASTYWLNRSWREQEPSARLRALAFASSLADSQGRDEVAAAMAAASLPFAVRASGVSAPLALMSAAEVAGNGARLVGRIERVCTLVPESATAARADCLVSALQSTVESGAVAPGLRLYDAIRRRRLRDPLLAMRLATAAIPLLELAGAFREAETLAERATVAATDFGNRELEGSFLVRLARARRLVGDYPGARAAARRAEKVTPATSPLYERARREQQASARAIAGEPGWLDAGGAASRRGGGADEVLSAGDVDLRAMLDEIGRAENLEAGAQAPEALDAYLHVLDGLAAMRRAAAPDLLSSMRLSDAWVDVSRRAIRLALRRQDAELALRLLERLRAFPAVPATEVDAILRLPRRTALLAYAVGPERTFAIVVRDGRVQLVGLSIGTRLLRDRVTLWREMAKANIGGDRWSGLGDSLAAALLEPVAARGLLDGLEQLYVVPDDVLHLLPFGTLNAFRRDDHVGAYAVTQVPSIAVLRGALAVPATGGALVAFGAGGGTGTLEEMAAIARAGGHAIVGSRATEAEWRHQSTSAAAIHFGGHATAAGAFDGSAALELRADAVYDGLLTVADILSLHLPGSTVVLLGCDTATRPEEPGPASYYRQAPSLAEAFLHAGARAVVGNLWPVTEEDAAMLSGEFYRAGGPQRGAPALAQARATLRSRFPETPRRWAGAVWLGLPDPQAGAASARR